MASLTVTVGPITATKTAGNAVVAALVDDYIAAYNGPAGMTAQQKADWFLAHLVNHIKEAANGASIRAARDSAGAAQAQAVTGRDWT